MYSKNLFRLCLIIQCSILVVVAQEQHDASRFLRMRLPKKTNGNHDQHQHRSQPQPQQQQQLPKSTSQFNLEEEKEKDLYFKNLVQRMKPHFLQVNPNDNTENEDEIMIDSLQTTTAPPYNPPLKQFYHLHHMKTGGTSLERYISCAISRYTKLYNLIQKDRNEDEEQSNKNQKQQSQRQRSFYFPQYKLSECAYSSYINCVSSPTNSSCHKSISQASIMTYCAPLAVTRHFGWNDDQFQTPSVTMMRHPVDRIWSMYRFQTRHCYQCKSLKEVYEDIDNGNVEEYGSGVCVPQLVNHFTRNLLTNLTMDELNGYSSQMTDEEKVRDAIHSVKYRFTVVGVIERLEETLKLFSYSFPWLSEEFDSEYYGSETDEYYQKHKDALSTCTFPHSNSSPRNNGCGENHSHMDIPDHPDDETRKIIEEHNWMDIKVYEAALEHFELQKRAMEWEEEEEMER